MALALPMESPQLVIGIDFGTADSYVGYIGKGIVDIVQNEVSQRKTPTLVGFTDRERLLGDAALSQIKSNVKNTCRNFKHVLGQKMDSPFLASEKFWGLCALAECEDGSAGFRVNYKGESTVFSPIDLTAMFLTKLVEITEAWCQGQVADVVIGVPSYFTDAHRLALLDAAQVAGLNVLRVINEHTATALSYGYFRSNDFDPEKPHTVAFCSMGHAVFSVSIVQFFRGKMTALCEKCETVGGRDMDECLIRCFAAQFQKKSGCDVLENKKAFIKLEDAVTKTKKILSANSEANISCEYLMEEQDFASKVERSDFLEMCKPMMKKVSDTLEAAKAACGVPLSSIEAVEISGGASRVPWLKEMCSKAFNKELSTTMNADEAVARGCTLQAAILSRLYKVREFKVEDTSPFPVTIEWMPPAGGEARSAVVFPSGSLMNLLKVVTFFRKENFEIKARYAEDSGVPEKERNLGAYTIVVPSSEEAKRIKVKIVLSLHGTFSIQGATLLEEEPGEDGAADASEDAPMPDAKEGAPTNKKKRKYKRTDLEVTNALSLSLPGEEMAKRRAKEEAMRKEMKEIIETNARRNDLESYILTMRSQTAEGGKYGAYIASADRDTLASALDKAEDWLYDHMDDGKEVFAAKLDELKVLGDPAINRFNDDSRQAEHVATLEDAIKNYRAIAEKPGPKYKGVDPAKLKTLQQVCQEAEAWLKECQAKQAKLAKHEERALTVEALEQRTEVVTKLAEGVLEDGAPGVSDAPPASPAPEVEKKASKNDMDVD